MFKQSIRTGAVVVAAGMSSRMNAFKPMLPLGSTTLIRTLIARLQVFGAAPIMVVVGHQSEILKKHVSDTTVQCVFNSDYAISDMFVSVCMGLSAIRTQVDRLFFLPGDIPLVALSTFHQLMDAMNESHTPIIIPSYRGKKGHPVLMRARVIPQVLSYSGERGLKGAMDALRNSLRILPVDDLGITLDADTPEDYEHLQRYADSQRYIAS